MRYLLLLSAVLPLFAQASAVPASGPPTDGLIGWYRGEDLTSGSITTWQDRSAYGNTLTAGATQPQVVTFSGFKTAYFGGDGSSVSVSNLTLPQNNVAVLFASLNGPGVFFNLGDLGGTLYLPMFGATGAATSLWYSNGNHYSGYSLPVGWTVHGYWSSASDAKVIFDGVTFSTGPLPSTVKSNFSVAPYSSNTYPPKVAIGEMLVYTRMTAATFSQATAYLTTKFGAPSSLRPNEIVTNGDSITWGTGSTNFGDYPHQAALGLGNPWAVYNVGASGAKISDLIGSAATKVDPLLNVSVSKNVTSILAGINDLSAGDSTTTVYNNIVTYCQARRTAGWKVVVMTLTAVSNPTSNANRATINASIRANWATFADGIADLGSDPNIGVTTSVTYFIDGLHMTNAGYAIAAGILETTLNGL